MKNSELFDTYESWENSEELLKIITEFDYKLYLQWLEKIIGAPVPWPKLLCEVSMHKCRTAFKTCPLELRKESKKWLVENGWTSEDPGDL